ncbi:Uncharacterised protein [Mycobacteroides abscessus subsp. abscessus]|nr:Uncharacterised protein [Mycobacteroides abscessus subsp. abscessus]
MLHIWINRNLPLENFGSTKVINILRFFFWSCTCWRIDNPPGFVDIPSWTLMTTIIIAATYHELKLTLAADC